MMWWYVTKPRLSIAFKFSVYLLRAFLSLFYWENQGESFRMTNWFEWHPPLAIFSFVNGHGAGSVQGGVFSLGLMVTPLFSFFISLNCCRPIHDDKYALLLLLLFSKNSSSRLFPTYFIFSLSLLWWSSLYSPLSLHLHVGNNLRKRKKKPECKKKHLNFLFFYTFFLSLGNSPMIGVLHVMIQARYGFRRI